MVEINNEYLCFFSPRIIFLKTYYPLHEKHFELLKKLLEIVRNRRIELYEEYYTKYKNKIPYDKLDAEKSLEIFEKECTKYIFEFNKYSVPKQFGRVFPFDYEDIYIKYETHNIESAKLAECSAGIKDLLNLLSFEDFLFIFLAILKVKSIIFISKNLRITTSIVMTFISLLKPFSWPYPAIYSLPESCLQLVNSSYPVIIGLKQSYKYIIKHILPDKNIQGGNETIFVFLDHSYIFTSENVVSDVTIPNFNGFFKQMKTDFGSLFSVKNSKN